jgi:hypothetical protein
MFCSKRSREPVGCRGIASEKNEKNNYLKYGARGRKPEIRDRCGKKPAERDFLARVVK